ncbi:MAG: hypothetical protein KGL62_16630, partial [Bradyrhizobium sp.]|uniref:hypothetical protein n=1 Tax=Bradyrhizobium sp. TaxID=376 RepID=UPI002397D20B
MSKETVRSESSGKLPASSSHFAGVWRSRWRASANPRLGPGPSDRSNYSQGYGRTVGLTLLEVTLRYGHG